LPETRSAAVSVTEVGAEPQARPPRPALLGHDHIWRLADGTGLHVPFATFAVSADQTHVFCHLCGRGFRHLGAHVRAHGLSAAAYRELVGLRARIPLTAADVSAGISVRQRRRWNHDPSVRAYFETGQQMARDGTLSWLARRGANSPQRAPQRREHLASGRATRERQRTAERDAVVARSGESDLHELLRTSYDGGASLADLAKTSGLGRARLRTELLAAGAVLRPTGHNTGEGKRRRADVADRDAAALVGADDIREWLMSQRAAGRTLAELSVTVSRSVPWVKSRLTSAVDRAG
jgi:hypothetical protein